jgi:hypothetical protein
MATIRISRTSEFVNRIRDYQIYLDGQKIGTVANGETIKFDTTIGEHTLIVKIDWCTSPELKINIGETDTKEFKVGGFKNANWMMLIGAILALIVFVLNKYVNTEWTPIIALPIFIILIYYITLGRKKYLTLTEIN